ncbi:MAG TPA: hypothetical protein VNT79_15805 [Phycisphaerae bacterium]|nr:hypothetical protein [Phycisphaerae bacterium]
MRILRPPASWNAASGPFVGVCALLAGVIALTFHGWVFRVPAIELGWRGEDDACYYYVIAKNIVAGQGATFDGVSRTNGFHPLWLGVCTAVFAAAGGNDAIALRTIYGIQWSLYVASAVGVGILARRSIGPMSALISALVFLQLPTISGSLLSGMETTLAVALVVAAFCLFDLIVNKNHSPEARTTAGRHRILLAIATAAASLARLECALLIPVLMYGLGWDRRCNSGPKFSMKAILIFGAASVVPLVTYLLFSSVYFGSSSPVSGLIKRAGALATANALVQSGDYLGLLDRVFQLRTPSDGLTAILASQLGFTLPAIVIRALGYLLLLGPLVVLHFQRSSQAGSLYLLFLFSALLVLAGKLLFYGRPLPAYYLVPLFASYPIAICVMAKALTSSVSFPAWPTMCRFSAAIAVLLLLVSAARLQWHRQHQILTHRDGYHDSVYAAAKWLEKNTHPRETAAAWNAGIIGFYSGRRVVNLDGYVNSVSFAKSITSNPSSLPALIDKQHINVLIDRISEGAAPLHRAPGLQPAWELAARVEATRPQGLNGGFCAYRRVKPQHQLTASPAYDE